MRNLSVYIVTTLCSEKEIEHRKERERDGQKTI